MIIPFNNKTPHTNDAVFIAPNATLIGNVKLGCGVFVWFGAVIRADYESIIIGENTNIQDNAVLHVDPGMPLTIGSSVTVGHAAVLHGCSIGDNCIIGMGAVILNGAEIGANSIVGAGALVKEQEKFPSGSLIAGHPATVKKPLKDPTIARMRKWANEYVANARKMAAACSD